MRPAEARFEKQNERIPLSLFLSQFIYRGYPVAVSTPGATTSKMTTRHRLPSIILFYVIVIACSIMTSAASLIPNTPARPPPLTPRARALYCTSQSSWLTPTFTESDCREADTRFILTDYTRYKTRLFEFLDFSSTKTSRFERMLTPRRYTIGTCTIVIAMLWSFPDQPPLPPLPGEPKGPFAQSEVVSFDTLLESVQQVFVECSKTPVPLGWLAAGRQRNIGVFFIATGSEVERNIPIGAG